MEQKLLYKVLFEEINKPHHPPIQKYIAAIDFHGAHACALQWLFLNDWKITKIEEISEVWNIDEINKA